MKRRRVNLEAILADHDLRRELMVPTIQALQAREGIDTTRDQAERAYYVVTEADKATFFDLERFRGGRRSQADRREEMFVRALVEQPKRIRFEVARRDFGTIAGSPLAYRRVGVVAHIFRETPAIDPTHGTVRQGLATSEDLRWVRQFWEVEQAAVGREQKWTPFAKGGEFSRFYSDVTLLIRWENEGNALKQYTKQKWGSITKRIYSQDWYFKAGLTWPQRTQKGFNIRLLPAGCIFGHKGPSLFLRDSRQREYFLGVMNSGLFEFMLQGLVSFGSWSEGPVKKMPVPEPPGHVKDQIAKQARAIHDAKASWDERNELSSRFTAPWLLLGNIVAFAVPQRLDHLAAHEATEEARIQQLYAELNDQVYLLYGIPDATRAIIEETLGERPPEILWPQMEKKTAEQKRMEHVWRLLSYVVKRVVEADEDGVVPFMAASGEAGLIDRVRAELTTVFPDQDINQVEVEITNELKRQVKGYRRVESLREWLEDVFFDYHVSLYKKRPILWHIASSEGRDDCAFSALVHYYKFDRDRLAKLRGSYLRDAIAHFRREAGLADQEGHTEDRQDWQAKLEEAQTLDRRLQWVQEGANGHPAPGDCRIRTPWKSDDELPAGWRPDLDDGVAVNILPLQTAGVLRISKVV